MMAMAFNYIPMAPQLKENFWGNFPYTTQLVRDCDTKYFYETRGNLSSAQNLYARGLEQVNGACPNVNAGVGIQENFTMAESIPLPGPVNELIKGITNEEDDELTAPETFQKDNRQNRENFTCLLSNNDGRSTLSKDFKPGQPLHTFEYGNMNPQTGSVPFNSCSGPRICRDRLMYSPARSRAAGARDMVRGDLTIAGAAIPTISQYAVTPSVGIGYMGSGTSNMVKATKQLINNSYATNNVRTGATFIAEMGQNTIGSVGLT